MAPVNEIFCLMAFAQHWEITSYGALLYILIEQVSLLWFLFDAEKCRKFTMHKANSFVYVKSEKCLF